MLPIHYGCRPHRLRDLVVLSLTALLSNMEILYSKAPCFCAAAAALTFRTSLSAALLTLAATLSGCAIKRKLNHETGFSPLRAEWAHVQGCTWPEVIPVTPPYKNLYISQERNDMKPPQPDWEEETLWISCCPRSRELSWRQSSDVTAFVLAVVEA